MRRSRRKRGVTLTEVLVAASFLGVSAASSVTAVTELTSNLARAEREVWVQNYIIGASETMCAQMSRRSGPAVIPPDWTYVPLPGGLNGHLYQGYIGVPFTDLYEIHVSMTYTEIQRGKEVERTINVSEYVRNGGW